MILAPIMKLRLLRKSAPILRPDQAMLSYQTLFVISQLLGRELADDFGRLELRKGEWKLPTSRLRDFGTGDFRCQAK